MMPALRVESVESAAEPLRSFAIMVGGSSDDIQPRGQVQFWRGATQSTECKLFPAVGGDSSGRQRVLEGLAFETYGECCGVAGGVQHQQDD